MPKHILIVGNITEAVEIRNSASAGKKDISHLEKDNFLYIDVLDYWTNLIKIFFKVPGIDNDIKGVDLVYESSIDGSKKLIDIKTQANITDSLNLYLREFNEEKISNRNYIIFNKKNKKLFGKVFFVSADLMKSLSANAVFIKLLQDIEVFEDLTQKYIESDETLSKTFKELKNTYDNTKISFDSTHIYVKFMPARKDKNGVVGNTCFKENIKLEISI